MRAGIKLLRCGDIACRGSPSLLTGLGLLFHSPRRNKRNRACVYILYKRGRLNSFSPEVIILPKGGEFNLYVNPPRHA